LFSTEITQFVSPREAAFSVQESHSTEAEISLGLSLSEDLPPLEHAESDVATQSTENTDSENLFKDTNAPYNKIAIGSRIPRKVVKFGRLVRIWFGPINAQWGNRGLA